MLPASVSVTVFCCCGDQIYDLTHGVAVKQEAFGVKRTDLLRHTKTFRVSAEAISHTDHEIQWPNIKSDGAGAKSKGV